MEDTLKEILKTLQGYGTMLRHIDQRFDTVEKLMELARANQEQLSKRESALEHQCRHQHKYVDDTLQSLARRITNLESKITPMPEPCSESCKETP